MGPSRHVSAVDRTENILWVNPHLNFMKYPDGHPDLNHQSKTRHWNYPLIRNHPKVCQGLSNGLYHRKTYYFSLSSLWYWNQLDLVEAAMKRGGQQSPLASSPASSAWLDNLLHAQRHLCCSEDHECHNYNSLTTQIDVLPKQVCAQQSNVFAPKKSSILDACIKDHHHMVCCGNVSVTVARLWLGSHKPWVTETELKYTTIVKIKELLPEEDNIAITCRNDVRRSSQPKHSAPCMYSIQVFSSAARAGYEKIPETSTNLSFWASVKSPSRETIIWRPSGSCPAVNKNHAHSVFTSKFHQIFANANCL